MTTALQVPLALHEAGVERLFARHPRTREVIPDEVLTSAASALRHARLAGEQINEMAAALRNDPTRTPAQVAIEMRRTVPLIAERTGNALDGAVERVSRTLAGLEAEMAPQPPLSAEAVSMAAETRAMLQRMSAEQRSQALAAAVTSGDQAVVSAVVRGSPILSGLTTDQHAALRGRWASTQHPEAFARADRLRRAHEALERAGKAAGEFVQAAVTLPGGEAAEKAAEVARAAVRRASGTEDAA